MSAQLDIQFAEPRYPKSSQSQLWTLLEALKRGEHLTVARALDHYNTYALSQRIGELRKLGWPISDTWRTTANGARIKEYFMPVDNAK